MCPASSCCKPRIPLSPIKRWLQTTVHWLRNNLGRGLYWWEYVQHVGVCAWTPATVFEWRVNARQRRALGRGCRGELELGLPHVWTLTPAPFAAPNPCTVLRSSPSLVRSHSLFVPFSVLCLDPFVCLISLPSFLHMEANHVAQREEIINYHSRVDCQI